MSKGNMSKRKNNNNSDLVFGQAPAFGLDDSAVNPLVLQYLYNVRNEAVTTNATQVAQLPIGKSEHNASMYDDDVIDTSVQEMRNDNMVGNSELQAFAIESSETIDSLNERKEVPRLLKSFQENLEEWIKWFDETRSTILNTAFSVQEYDKDTMDLLLFFLKEYLQNNISDKRGITLHILNLLKDHRVAEAKVTDAQWTIDDDWVSPTLKRLNSIRIRNIDDIKICLTGDYASRKPKNFKQWNQFTKENEPLNSMFATMIDQDDMWIIIKFINQNWLKSMVKNPDENKKICMWLLCVLFYLPDILTANHTSILRDLGKKCQRYLLQNASSDKLGDYPVILTDVEETTEMKILETKPTPKDLNIIELTLAIIAVKYRQTDLIRWDNVLQDSR